MQGSRLDPLYSRVAAELVARISGRAAERAASVKVICWSEKGLAGALGRVRRRRQDGVRRVLARLGSEGSASDQPLVSRLPPSWDRIAYHDSHLALPATGAAVGALAHEAMHVAGIHNEGTAECYGVQLTATAAMGLGVEREYADRLRTVNFEFDREERAGTAYDSADCYDGGPLDLAPEGSRWP